MARSPEERRCPDCGGTLVPIRLFGRGPLNPFTGAAIAADVAYYADEPARRGKLLASIWKPLMFKASGSVRAARCTACDRIFLHAAPASP